MQAKVETDGEDAVMCSVKVERDVPSAARLSSNGKPFVTIGSDCDAVSPARSSSTSQRLLLENDTWQSTVYKDLSALHVQHKWFRLAHD